MKEMQRLQWDIVSLAEWRWKDQGVLELDEGRKGAIKARSIWCWISSGLSLVLTLLVTASCQLDAEVKSQT